MTVYVKDGETRHISELRQMYPNTSLPDGGSMEHEGWFHLLPSAPPDPLPWHTVVASTPVNNTQVWEQVPMGVEEVKSECLVLVQNHLDSVAKAHGYDNIISACSYAGAPNPFQDESAAFITWRGNVWATCYGILSDVTDGIRQIPSVDELIAELPEF